MTVSRPLSVVLQLIMLYVVISAGADVLIEPADYASAIMKGSIALVLWWVSAQTPQRKQIKS